MDQSQEKALLAYCLNKPGAYADQPFGPDSLVVKVAGHIFAQFGCGKDRDRITLKCSRQWGEFYRRQFPGLVTRGYHCPPVQQPYWNTLLPEEFPWEELLNLADHASTGTGSVAAIPGTGKEERCGTRWISSAVS